MPEQWTVIENTPGYMPESEPVTFSTYAEAIAYARKEAAECAYQTYGPVGGVWNDDEVAKYVSESFTENAYARFDICSNEPHDLGRVIEVSLAD